MPLGAFATADAQGDHRSGAPDTTTIVQQARINPATVRFPIVEGTDIRFARPGTSDGLSHTVSEHIVQGSEGFMWFGTQYGLERFDGYNYKTFVHDPTNPNSLSGVYVSAIFKDRDGTLWVGCGQFLNRFNRETETFTRYPIPFVVHISQDAAGILWLATRTGLYGLDPATGRIRRYVHEATNPSSLSSSNVRWSGEDRAGGFWVTNSEGLDKFDPNTGKVALHIPDRDSAGLFFFEDRSGTFWIYQNTDKALGMFDRKTNVLTYFSLYEKHASRAAFTGVRSMLEDRNGNIWIGTTGAGLLKFDREHRRFVRYRKIPGDPDSIGQDTVVKLYEDREGNIWAGLGGVGVTRFTPTPLPFKRYRHDFGDPNSTGEPFVGAIYEDKQGILWVGKHEALNRIDRDTGQYAAYTTARPGEGTDAISICEDRSGNLWVGTYSHGLYRFDRQTRRFKRFQHDSSDPYSLSSNIVPRLLVDHNGALWAATSDGLDRFDPATERFTTYKVDPQKGRPSYLELVEDQQGALWLGTDSSGLERFDPVTGKFTVYQHDMNRPGALSDNRVNSVHFDRTGTMWVGTQDGLNKLNPNTESFTVYTQRDGLPGNTVGCVLEDGHGALWMSTNNGVARFDPQTKSVRSYSTGDGLPGPDLTGWGACFKSAAGEMFFGGFSGATAFFPDRVPDSAYVPQIVLTDFKLFGTTVSPGAGSLLSKTVNFTQGITLPHRQNIFSIEFSALSFTNPATNRYRYMLEGLDQHWNEVGSNQRVASYTTLPAGAYTFRVQGATSHGAWTDPGLMLQINILPPWWETWWFIVLSIAVLMLLVSSAYSYRLRQVENEYRARVEERVSERTRIARDLHDTLIQSFHGLLLSFQTVYDLLPSRPTEAKRSLGSAIDEAAEAITEGRDAVQGLRSAVETNDIVEAIRGIGEELAAVGTNPTSVVFRAEVEGTPRNLHPILRDEVYRIAREALRNAFRHAGARQIEVELHYDDRHFRLRVRDDGKGFDPKIPGEDGRAGHFGLHGMRERAQLAGGKLAVFSEPDSGTEIELAIPASTAYGTSPRRSWLSEKFWGKSTETRTKS
jgi:signal transduction histidine kinase/ligand-binding sensor domain-containing protein